MEVKLSMDTAQWQDWFVKAQSSAQLVKSFLSLYRDNDDLLNDVKFETLWQKVILTKFYIEHLGKNEELMLKRCIVLWNSFPKANFKTMDTYKAFIKILTTFNNVMRKYKLKNVETCKGCNSNTYETLYKIAGEDCKCTICEACQEELKQNKKCPACSEKCSKFTSKWVRDNSFTEEYNKFKANMNAFYMDVVNNLCFGDSLLPESAVIDAIIVDVLPKSKAQLEHTDDQLFDLNISPSIKSTLFQLLLSFKQKLVEDHLNQVLSKSSKYIETNYETKDIVNVKLMYTNSIEDQFYSKGLRAAKKVDNLNADIQLGLRFFGEALDEFSLDDYEKSTVRQNSIQELKLIAKIKFCLTTCARLIFECDYINQTHTKFIQMTQQFVEANKSCLWFRFFLIKQIFRKYGKADLIKSTQMDMFKWIVPGDLLANSADVSCLLYIYIWVKTH